ncbi:MAG: hypothetical protein MJE68_28190 [Proteobacteria bacterium]|nr:hypothetical protein [Pseudomonadota bacterium]
MTWLDHVGSQWQNIHITIAKVHITMGIVYQSMYESMRMLYISRGKIDETSLWKLEQQTTLHLVNIPALMYIYVC